MKRCMLTLMVTVTLMCTGSSVKAFWPLPTPTLTSAPITLDVDVELSGGVLMIEGSNQNANGGGDVIDLRLANGWFTRTIIIAGRRYQRRVFTTLLEVRSGAFENADGTFTVAKGNTAPEGIVFSAPVSNIDAVMIDLRSGNDQLIIHPMDLPIEVWLGSGNDTCACQSTGNTSVFGGFGEDEIHCLLAGPSRIWGGPGDDFIIGSRFDDEINGGDGNDDIFADDGNDIINGSYGDDYIDGQDGHDVIEGGYGADKLYGGQGVDILIGSNLQLTSWPLPDANGIRFTQSELEQLLPDFHTNDKAGDVLRGNGDNDFIIWWRFQDSIDFPDPDGWSWWVNSLFGRVWRDAN